MPQDSRRSVVYRSFVSCDDPNGVVECGTIRKSKTNPPKMEQSTEARRTWRDSNLSLLSKEEKKEMVSKGISEELHTPHPFQLLEVSRGANKLNQMIDSWSKGPSCVGQSKDIARDLLKGALDLQESLIMLGKLQEASKSMDQLKKKQKSKSEQGGEIRDEEGTERTDSDRFGDRNYQMGLQKPRLSADGSSRNGLEELKKVIKDSLFRQNLLSDTYPENRTYLGQMNLDSASDIPSTSSSQSSMVHSNNSASADSSRPSRAQQNKAKGPSVIAKLMGLEEFPLESIQPLKKQMDIDNFSNQQRPIFDIDMPKARRPQFVERTVDPERRTLKEILETMQFKGLLKSNSFKGLKHTGSKQRSDDDVPPIVIIKPFRCPCPETEEPLSGRFIQDEGALDSKEMFRKLETKEDPSTSPIIRGGTLDSKVMLRELKTKEEPLTKMISREKGALNSKVMLRKLEAKKKTPTKMFIQEGAILVKPDDKELVTRELKTKEKVSSNKMKASVSVNRKPQKKEVTDKKTEKVQKVSPDRRKPVERENLKSKTVSKCQERATKLKSENGSIITKNHVSREGSTIQNPNSTRSMQPVSQNSAHRMKKKQINKAKPVRESLPTSLVTENLKCKDDDKGINLTCEMDSILTRTNTLLADQLLTAEGTKAYEIQIEDHRNASQNSVCEVTPRTSQQKRSIESAEEANHLIDHKTTERRSFVTETDLKCFLLSSPSFLSCAEELFDLGVNQSVVLQTNGIEDVEMVNTRLFLDCANELMERKSLRRSRMDHPLLQTYLANPRIGISLDQLVEEVCDGVENLFTYSKFGGDEYTKDSLHLMLKRDLWCKGEVVNGIWELGWMNRFSVHEANQVVGEVEKQVLGGLIEEVLTDLML
ncbi:hypothetical protein HHK36_014104 [Tetracentron sinense]|uniref:DUF4378 domain-containing protein n=1 Tax=Tetracentron sinense TaxID=13715 RepID=A0A835DHE3_TETSI|nr:hypothetical protein HHK36_014104 [Tetracentron sinense]